MNTAVNFFNNELSPTMEAMYDGDKLANFPLFQGGYINFGYWQGIDYQHQKLSAEDRILSSKNLYLYIFNLLKINSDDCILEAGCGQGLGSKILVQKYGAEYITGLDIVKGQIKTARHKNIQLLNTVPHLQFIHGSAEDMPFQDNKFNRIFSIEAPQHFKNFKNFASESFRVLKDNGYIVITTFFKQKKGATRQLDALIPGMAQSIGMGPPLEEALNNFHQAGFTHITHHSIGKYVWEGFDAWMAQTPYLTSNWGRNWLKAYHSKLIDYYVICATKS